MNPITAPTTTTTVLFNFNDQGIRTQVDPQGNPWFVAVDVCAALFIKNSREATSKLDADELGVINCDTSIGKREFTTVNESGLYELIFRSRKKEAQEFKRWIKRVVLPTIRKDGAYFKDEELILSDALSVEEIESRLKAFNDHGDQLIADKVAKLRAERLRELAEDKQCRSDAFRYLAGKSPRR